MAIQNWACQACKEAKVGCSRPNGQHEVCERCVTRGLECIPVIPTTRYSTSALHADIEHIVEENAQLKARVATLETQITTTDARLQILETYVLSALGALAPIVPRNSYDQPLGNGASSAGPSTAAVSSASYSQPSGSQYNLNNTPNRAVAQSYGVYSGSDFSAGNIGAYDVGDVLSNGDPSFQNATWASDLPWN